MATLLKHSGPPEHFGAMPTPLVRRLARFNLLRTYIYQQILSDLLDHSPLENKLSEQLLDQFRQSQGVRDQAGEQILMRKLGFSEEDFRWQAELSYRVGRYADHHFGAKAEARFLDRKSHLDHVVYRLVRVKDGALAKELHQRVLEGEAEFGELALAYSDGPERDSNGLIGPVPLAKAHPQLQKQLRCSSPGTLLAPFQVEQWWLIVRLESLQPASLDDAMRKRMALELLDESIQEDVTTKISALLSAPHSPPE